MNTKVKNTQPVKTRIANAYLKDGILHIALLDSLMIEQRDIEELLLPIAELCGDSQYCIFVDSGNNNTFSMRCRQAYAEGFEKWRLAEAIVARSFHHRLAAQLYISLAKPVAPVRIFQNHETALKWLHEMNRNFGI